MANLSTDEEDYCDTAEYRVGNKPGKARSGQASAAASGGGAGSSGGGGGSGGGSGGGGVSPGPGSASSSSAGPAQGQGSGLRSAISSGARRRRTRCRKCEACVRTECGECTFCKDMKKFGGPGKMKQSCIMRQCIAPILPHTAVCRICGEAGKEDAAEGEEEKFSMTLMECSICNEIVHPACLKIDDKEGVINDELPNCWECPKCNQEGKTGKQKRGPGFKYASNLPGSMLRECGERRRSEQDDAFPRRRSDEALKREHARSDDDADDDSDADSRFGSVGEDDDDGGADEEEEEEEDEGRRRDRDEDEEAAAALEVSEAAAESVAAAGTVTPTVPAASDAAMLSDHSPASPPSPAGSVSSPPPLEPPPPLPTAAVVAASAAVQHTPANANRKGTEDGVVVSKKRKEVDGVQQPLGQKKKVKVEKAEKLLRKKKQKAVEVNNGRVESGHRREGPAAWLERRGVASEQGRAWRGTDKQSSAASDAPAAAVAAAAAGPSGRENERKPNKHSRDAATAGITGGGSGGGGGGGGVTAGEHRSKTRDANDRVRPAKPHATSKASSWGLHKPEQNSVGNSSAGRNNANNNSSSSSNGNSGDGSGTANSTNKNHRAPLVKSEEDGENGNNRTPRLFSSSERLQKAAKSLNGIPRGGPAARQPQQQLQLQQLQQQQAAGLAQAQAPRLCGVNARLGGLPRPPSSVSPPKPHLLERHVIKPPLVSPPPDALPLGDGGSHPLRREAWLGVFRFLSHRDLCVCMRVCKTWNRWCCDRRLWAKIDLSRCKSVTPLMLSGIIKRQPSALDLSWSNVSKKQLAWLVNRLPGLKELVLSGCPWASVSALCGASWPPLRALDLRWAEGVKDAHIRDLLSPDSDYTPGAEDRLRGVSELRLAGLDITDASVALLVRLAAGLSTLDLAHCAHLTDQAVNVLTAPGAPTRDSLRHLVLAGCARITDACLPLLVRCPHLSRADLRSCKLVTPEACQRLVTELCPQGTFALPEDRLILRVTSTGS